MSVGDYEGVNNFFKEFQLSKKEVKSLKKKLNFLNNFLTSGKINLVVEHLKWLDASDEEVEKLKNQIDPAEIFSVLIQKNKFRAVEDFLTWRLNTEKERKKERKLKIF